MCPLHWPINDETEIANDVIDGLLNDPEMVRRISEIERGWPGMHEPTSGKIMMSFFRERGRGRQRSCGGIWRIRSSTR